MVMSVEENKKTVRPMKEAMLKLLSCGLEAHSSLFFQPETALASSLKPHSAQYFVGAGLADPLGQSYAHYTRREYDLRIEALRTPRPSADQGWHQEGLEQSSSFNVLNSCTRFYLEKRVLNNCQRISVTVALKSTLDCFIEICWRVELKRSHYI